MGEIVLGCVQAVRDRDVIVDEFTVILSDVCGAETEIPATVVIRVEDKAPPEILRPAQDRTVECDGKGNTAALASWLGIQGGAWATDNCGEVTWSHRVEEYVPTCGGAGRYRVTFTATEAVDSCAA